MEFRHHYKLGERLALKYSYDYVSNTVYIQQPYRTVCLCAPAPIVNTNYIGDCWTRSDYMVPLTKENFGHER